MSESKELLFDFGELVRDRITGFRGTITGFACYFQRSESYYLVENIDSTGRPIEQWVQDARIERVDLTEDF